MFWSTRVSVGDTHRNRGPFLEVAGCLGRAIAAPARCYWERGLRFATSWLSTSAGNPSPGPARRVDRGVSGVSRRLALVELLPEAIPRRVRECKISAHPATGLLVIRT